MRAFRDRSDDSWGTWILVTMMSMTITRRRSFLCRSGFPYHGCQRWGLSPWSGFISLATEFMSMYEQHDTLQYSRSASMLCSCSTGGDRSTVIF
jgi:hypothetical protein